MERLPNMRGWIEVRYIIQPVWGGLDAMEDGGLGCVPHAEAGIKVDK